MDLCFSFDFRCTACGMQRPLTIDHVLPISMGGTNEIGNIQPLCQFCNGSKGKRHIDYRLNPFQVRPVYSEENYAIALNLQQHGATAKAIAEHLQITQQIVPRLLSGYWRTLDGKKG